MRVRQEGRGGGILPKPLIYFSSLKKRKEERDWTHASNERGYVFPPRLALALSLLAMPAVASPPGASSCAGCHGGGGLPVLAGQPAEAVAAAMLAYQAGERSPTVMDRIARGFTEAEIRAIAAWVAAPP